MDSTETTPINFRFLPAYRKHKRTCAVALTETVDHVVVLTQDGGKLLPAEVEKVIISREDSSSSSVTKPPSLMLSNRKRKCVELCKRLAAFLLSTLGLSLMTVMYAVAGGYLFQALESQNDETVKTCVQEALHWHIEALWNSTASLNVLHPVSRHNRVFSDALGPIHVGRICLTVSHSGHVESCPAKIYSLPSSHKNV